MWARNATARLLEVGEIVRVVHDAHRVRLHEADPNVVGEVVIGRVDGRLDGQTHPPSLAPPRPT